MNDTEPIEAGDTSEAQKAPSHSLHAVVLRFAAVARWDMRWRVVALEARNDADAITEAFVSLVVGLVMLPVAVATFVFRLPLKPLQWLWLAWRHPEAVERARTIMDQAQNADFRDPAT